MYSPTETIKGRGNDPTGHGYYGAKRGKRKHKGWDLVAYPEQRIISPHGGKITKLGYCYEGNMDLRYIEITDKIYRSRLLYVKPLNIKVGDLIMDCHEIGTAQDIASHWGNGMINHIHWQIWKHGLLTDPEPLVLDNTY